MSLAQLPTTTDASPSDALLARLDFANDALTLNLGALTRFGNPFLVDVTCAALLSVAVAEAQRSRASRHSSRENFFAAPPVERVDPSANDISDARAFSEAFRDGFHAVGGKVKVPGRPAEAVRKWSSKSRSSSKSRGGSFDKDIELGEWYGQDKGVTKVGVKEKKRKEKEKEKDGLPFVARAIISVLTFAFKAAVFVMKVVIKIVAGVVVMITRNFGRL